ncbi:MAG TPA: alpha-hydroxy-acid oxidizing protein [Gaiellaceae bacterium]|nr:alpha-hydroxy-acid oxidizing protein [Gaiellaceae bacterium]
MRARARRGGARGRAARPPRRAPVFGLAAAGEEGVRHVLELLRDELALALCLLGCASPDELTSAHVQRSAS